VKKQSKTEILAALVAEGFADSAQEAIEILADMGMTWQDIRDGKWY
jgi:F0F1-type ATP synthase epsilon subunit